MTVHVRTSARYSTRQVTFVVPECECGWRGPLLDKAAVERLRRVVTAHRCNRKGALVFEGSV